MEAALREVRAASPSAPSPPLSEPSLASSSASDEQRRRRRQRRRLLLLYVLLQAHGGLLLAAGLARQSPAALAYQCAFAIHYTVAAPSPWKRLFNAPMLLLLVATLGCAIAGLALAAEGMSSFGHLGWDIAVGTSTLLALGLGINSRCCALERLGRRPSRSSASLSERALFIPLAKLEAVVTAALLALACIVSVSVVALPPFVTLSLIGFRWALGLPPPRLPACAIAQVYGAAWLIADRALTLAVTHYDPTLEGLQQWLFSPDEHAPLISWLVLASLVVWVHIARTLGLSESRDRDRDRGIARGGRVAIVRSPKLDTSHSSSRRLSPLPPAIFTPPPSPPPPSPPAPVTPFRSAGAGWFAAKLKEDLLPAASSSSPPGACASSCSPSAADLPAPPNLAASRSVSSSTAMARARAAFSVRVSNSPPSQSTLPSPARLSPDWSAPTNVALSRRAAAAAASSGAGACLLLLWGVAFTSIAGCVLMLIAALALLRAPHWYDRRLFEARRLGFGRQRGSRSRGRRSTRGGALGTGSSSARACAPSADASADALADAEVAAAANAAAAADPLTLESLTRCGAMAGGLGGAVWLALALALALVWLNAQFGAWVICMSHSDDWAMAHDWAARSGLECSTRLRLSTLHSAALSVGLQGGLAVLLGIACRVHVVAQDLSRVGSREGEGLDQLHLFGRVLGSRAKRVRKRINAWYWRCCHACSQLGHKLGVLVRQPRSPKKRRKRRRRAEARRRSAIQRYWATWRRAVYHELKNVLIFHVDKLSLLLVLIAAVSARDVLHGVLLFCFLYLATTSHSTTRHLWLWLHLYVAALSLALTAHLASTSEPADAREFGNGGEWRHTLLGLHGDPQGDGGGSKPAWSISGLVTLLIPVLALQGAVYRSPHYHRLLAQMHWRMVRLHWAPKTALRSDSSLSHVWLLAIAPWLSYGCLLFGAMLPPVSLDGAMLITFLVILLLVEQHEKQRARRARLQRPLWLLLTPVLLISLLVRYTCHVQYVQEELFAPNRTLAHCAVPVSDEVHRCARAFKDAGLVPEASEREKTPLWARLATIALLSMLALDRSKYYYFANTAARAAALRRLKMKRRVVIEHVLDAMGGGATARASSSAEASATRGCGPRRRLGCLPPRPPASPHGPQERRGGWSLHVSKLLGIKLLVVRNRLLAISSSVMMVAMLAAVLVVALTDSTVFHALYLLILIVACFTSRSRTWTILPLGLISAVALVLQYIFQLSLTDGEVDECDDSGLPRAQTGCTLSWIGLRVADNSTDLIGYLVPSLAVQLLTVATYQLIAASTSWDAQAAKVAASVNATKGLREASPRTKAAAASRSPHLLYDFFVTRSLMRSLQPEGSKGAASVASAPTPPVASGAPVTSSGAPPPPSSPPATAAVCSPPPVTSQPSATSQRSLRSEPSEEYSLMSPTRPSALLVGPETSEHAVRLRTQRRLALAGCALLESLALFTLLLSGLIRLNVWGLLYVGMACWLSVFARSRKRWGLRILARALLGQRLGRLLLGPKPAPRALSPELIGAYGGTFQPSIGEEEEEEEGEQGEWPELKPRPSAPTLSVYARLERTYGDRRYAACLVVAGAIAMQYAAMLSLPQSVWFSPRRPWNDWADDWGISWYRCDDCADCSSTCDRITTWAQPAVTCALTTNASDPSDSFVISASTTARASNASGLVCYLGADGALEPRWLFSDCIALFLLALSLCCDEAAGRRDEEEGRRAVAEPGGPVLMALEKLLLRHSHWVILVIVFSTGLAVEPSLLSAGFFFLPLNLLYHLPSLVLNRGGWRWNVLRLWAYMVPALVLLFQSPLFGDGCADVLFGRQLAEDGISTSLQPSEACTVWMRAIGLQQLRYSACDSEDEDADCTATEGARLWAIIFFFIELQTRIFRNPQYDRLVSAPARRKLARAMEHRRSEEDSLLRTHAMQLQWLISWNKLRAIKVEQIGERLKQLQPILQREATGWQQLTEEPPPVAAAPSEASTNKTLRALFGQQRSSKLSLSRSGTRIGPAMASSASTGSPAPARASVAVARSTSPMSAPPGMPAAPGTPAEPMISDEPSFGGTSLRFNEGSATADETSTKVSRKSELRQASVDLLAIGFLDRQLVEEALRACGADNLNRAWLGSRSHDQLSAMRLILELRYGVVSRDPRHRKLEEGLERRQQKAWRKQQRLGAAGGGGASMLNEDEAGSSSSESDEEEHEQDLSAIDESLTAVMSESEEQALAAGATPGAGGNWLSRFLWQQLDRARHPTLFPGALRRPELLSAGFARRRPLLSSFAQRVADASLMIGQVLVSKSEQLLFLMAILVHTIHGNLLSLPFPLFVFLHGNLNASIDGSRHYWLTLLRRYTFCVLALKLLWQLPIVCDDVGYPWFDSEVQPLWPWRTDGGRACGSDPSRQSPIVLGPEYYAGLPRREDYLIGLEKHRGLLALNPQTFASAVLPEMLLLAALLLHLEVLRTRGVDLVHGVVAKSLAEASDENASYRSEAAEETSEPPLGGLLGAVYPRRLRRASGIAMSGWARSIRGEWLTLLQRSRMLGGRDLYMPSFQSLLMLLAYAVYFFLGPAQTEDELNSSAIPSSIVVVVFVGVATMALDRLNYKMWEPPIVENDSFSPEPSAEQTAEGTELAEFASNLAAEQENDLPGVKKALARRRRGRRKSNHERISLLRDEQSLPTFLASLRIRQAGERALALKLVVHVTCVCLAHGLFFFYPRLSMWRCSDAAGETTCTRANECCYQLLSVQIFYLLGCRYLYLSASQLRQGFPLVQREHPLTDSGSWLRVASYKYFLYLPFFWEVMKVLDWSVAYTALDISSWLKVEDIYAGLCITRCDLFWRRQYPRDRRHPWYNKVWLGGCFAFGMLVVIVGPLYLFSSLAPFQVPNQLISAEAMLSYKGARVEGLRADAHLVGGDFPLASFSRYAISGVSDGAAVRSTTFARSSCIDAARGDSDSCAHSCGATQIRENCADGPCVDECDDCIDKEQEQFCGYRHILALSGGDLSRLDFAFSSDYNWNVNPTSRQQQREGLIRAIQKYNQTHEGGIAAAPGAGECPVVHADGLHQQGHFVAGCCPPGTPCEALTCDSSEHSAPKPWPQLELTLKFNQENDLVSDSSLSCTKVLTIHQMRALLAVLSGDECGKGTAEVREFESGYCTNSSVVDIDVELMFPKFVRLRANDENTAALATPIGFDKGDLWHVQQNVTLQVNRSVAQDGNGFASEAAWWWSVRQQPDASPFDTTRRNGPTVYVVQSTISGGILTSVIGSSTGVAGVFAFYISVVLLLGKIIAAAFRNTRYRIMYDELPDVRDLTDLCEGMYIARKQKDLEQETLLHETILRLYRSPQVMLQVTGERLKRWTPALHSSRSGRRPSSMRGAYI